MKCKSMLFNSEMVKAIWEGRKTQTRRIVRCKSSADNLTEYSNIAARRFISLGNAVRKCPCASGDILWVRETWRRDAGRYMYRANYAENEKFYRNGKEVQLKWSSSVCMPKEAARIFLRVKDVHVERLQEMTVLDAINEGCSGTVCDHADALPTLGCTDCCNTGWLESPKAEFVQLWDTTIKPTDLDIYGWEANPWVWVIEFELCEKPDGWAEL